MSATGTIYRVDLPRGKVIALKKLWRSQKEIDVKEQHILGKVDVLGSVRYKNMDVLQNLDVLQSRLLGPLLEDLLTALVLQNLDVSFNLLSCRFSEAIWKMQSLEKFYTCSFNIVDDILQVEQGPPLFTLDLSNNLLARNISSGLDLFQRHTQINLKTNKLSGPIPTKLPSLPKCCNPLQFSKLHSIGSF